MVGKASLMENPLPVNPICPVWCGYRPVNMALRDELQDE